MNDVDHQKLMPVGSPASGGERAYTIAAAATIAPPARFTRVTGATVITTITPPITSYHELVLVFSTGTASQLDSAGGNIRPTTVTTITDRPIQLFYDPRTGLYYIGTVA